MAHFVPNFVAMATGVGRGKMRLAAFDDPSPKTPLWSQKSPILWQDWITIKGK